MTTSRHDPRVDAYIENAAEFARPAARAAMERLGRLTPMKDVPSKKVLVAFVKKAVVLKWITEAGRDETRARRVARTLQWLAEGKSANWKYI